jgi:hypothetical protein
MEFVIQEELVLQTINVNAMQDSLVMIVKSTHASELMIQNLFVQEEENVLQLTNVNVLQVHQEPNAK